MESEIEQTRINSDFFDKEKFLKQLDIIKQASELAQSKIDYASAHDDNIIRAIDVVEEFLRKKHRLCYGGQAINAHLPAKYKFYNPEFSIPDYDFFTPNQDSDIQTLVRDLKKAGFTEISVREGMHEGTIKIYVDFIPVADMTSIDPKLYRILSKREFRLDGISYLDANSLRMLMYLELSRPRGEVRRWGKVFERLSLFNEFVPIKQCKLSRNIFRGGLTYLQTQYILNYIIDNKRIFAGADLLEFYDQALKYKQEKANWLLSSKKPIIFFSPNTDNDSKIIQEEFNFIINQTKKIKDEQSDSNILPKMNSSNKPITIKSYSSKGVDIIPSMKVITQGDKSLVFIIDKTACHSYINIPIDDGKIMRIASMDTLITLYFGLGLIDSKFYDMGSMECLANHLVQISIKARQNPEQFIFPFISIKCSGHQTSLPSLIRAKVKRITQKKMELKELLENKPAYINKKQQTNRQQTNRRHTIRRQTIRRQTNRRQAK
jgi:hypothetical protein